MPRSRHGGRHELGQNFLIHQPTVKRLIGLIASTSGSILEIGAGDGALTHRLARLGRPVQALEIDEHRAAQLARDLPEVTVRRADALRHRLRADVIVGNLPFHLTTPLLRRILTQTRWNHAVLITQWEVARKRAGVGGGTMLTAQTGPWYRYELAGRVPATGFRPQPSVDGGILQIDRRAEPLVPAAERTSYQQFVRRVFQGRGGTLPRILKRLDGRPWREVNRALDQADVAPRSLPRDLGPEQWAALWARLGRDKMRA